VDASHGVSNIALSMGELSGATNSIAQNTEIASNMMEAAVSSAKKILQTSDEINLSMVEANHLSNDTSSQANATAKAANRLAETATHLDTLVRKFTI